jgi:RNA polymerase sigma-70 factor (ECF subfamily)
VWRKKEQLNPALSLNALLFKITKDLSFNYLKKAARELTFRLALKEKVCHAPTNFTEDQVLSEEYDQMAAMAIDELPPQRRTIFMMRRQGGMSYEEIADQLGISKNTVKVQLVKASKFLKEYFISHTDISFLWALSLLYL